MNKRASMIFSTILSSSKALQVSSLANTHKVSDRTIRNDLQAIDDLLSSKGLPALSISPNGQITYTANRANVLGLVKDTDLYVYRLSKSERRTIVTLQLLLAEDYITIAELAESVEVSRATMLNDLPEIKDFFKAQQLCVESRPNKGLRIIGEEKEKRLTAMDLLSSTVQIFDTDSTYSPYQSILLSLIDHGENRKLCERVLKTVEQRQNHYLSDLSFCKASNYLILAVRRMQSGQYLNTDTLDKGEHYTFSKEVISYLTNQFDLEVLDGEIQLFDKILQGLRYIKRKLTDYHDILKLQTLATNFIRKISEDLKIDLTDDYTFYSNLTNHLQSTITNVGNHEQDEDLQQILRTRYGDVKDYAHRHVHEFERFIKRRLSDADVSYIVLHVCAAIERKRNQKLPARVLVACAGGVGTSQLLTERLRRQFHFDILAITAVHNLDQYLKSDIDLIITTVPLQKTACPFVVVTPFLNDGDYLKIQKQLESLHREDAKKDYVDAMLSNLEENGPYVVISPGFAIPHASLDSGVLCTGMSFIRLQNPVCFGHEEYDPVDLVCCLGAVDSHSHIKAFFNLINMLQTDGFKQELRSARKPEQVHESIRKYEILVNQR